MSETIRDVVFRLKIELAEAAMKAPDVRPVVEAHEKVKKAAQDTTREVEKSADTHRKETERIGEIMRKDYEKSRAAREKLARDVQRMDEQTTRQAERAAQQQGRAAERAARLQELAHFRVGVAMTKALDGAAGLAKGIALMSVSGEKDTEKMIRGFIRITAGIDALKGLVQTYKAITDAIRTATAAQIALNAAQAGGGKAGVGALGVGGRLAAGLGPVGGPAAAVIIGTGAMLTGINEIDKRYFGNRLGIGEGLGELTGFSDMAGDERERAAKRVMMGETYNRGIAAARAAGQQKMMLEIERDTLNMRPLEKTEFAINKLESAREQSQNLDQQRDLLEKIVVLQERRVDLTGEQLKGQRDSMIAMRSEMEAQQKLYGNAALSFLNLKPGEQRQTVSALEKLRRGDDLSAKELNRVNAQSQLIGPEGQRLVNQQSIKRLEENPAFAALTAWPKQMEANLQAQLEARQGALDKTMAQYGDSIAEMRERIVKGAFEPLIKMMEALAKEQEQINAEAWKAALQSARTDVGGQGGMAAFFLNLGRGVLWNTPGDRASSARSQPRSNGQ